ncbi:MAG: lipid-transfer protein [Candidatus Dadabacteria bacterium]|nr:MAG: lipid-transfer protein [Candidatus Dadabacteria bacterium]
MPTGLKDVAAIVGIGETEYSKDSGRSELRLALEAVKAAIDDAGLGVQDIDGMVTYSIDGSDEIAIARGLGNRALRFFSRVPHGIGGAIALVHQAVMAVASGSAKAVVGYRGLNGHSGLQLDPTTVGGPLSTDQIHWSWYVPYGLIGGPSWAAIFARRYMDAYGASEEALAEIAVTMRRHAAGNPHAIFHGKPLSREDYFSSPMVAEPLRLADCALDVDGAAAFVVTSLERARDLRHPPVVVRAVAHGAAPDQEVMTSFYRPELAEMPEYDLVARQCYEQSGLRPEDIDVALLYDAFTPIVLFQLESFGFCPRGQAHEFVRDGALAIDGRLPTNTNGGQLGEGHLQGVNAINEAVRLIRGQSANQPQRCDHVLATGGFGVPTSAMIVGRAV